MNTIVHGEHTVSYELDARDDDRGEGHVLVDLLDANHIPFIEARIGGKYVVTVNKAAHPKVVDAVKQASITIGRLSTLINPRE